MALLLSSLHLAYIMQRIVRAIFVLTLRGQASSLGRENDRVANPWSQASMTERNATS